MAEKIEAQGGRTIKINFNASDWLYSVGMNAVNFRRSSAVWPGWIREFARENQVTDVILYGDCREYHRLAISILRPMGIIIHVLEEGYVRPAWITYERNGVNGHSRLADMSLADIDKDRVLAAKVDSVGDTDGTMWAYVCSGILYYATAYWTRPLFPFYKNHRPQGTLEEAWMWLKRLPFLRKSRSEARIRGALMARGHKPYFLILLQLAGDSQMRNHSGFQSISEFIELCMRSFSTSASPSEHLIFKSHPLDANAPYLSKEINILSKRYGLEERCELIDGGKLAYLAKHARGVVSINSTACQVSIRRGVPTKVLGRAIYNHRSIAAKGSLEEFFSDPQAPDVEAYKLFRQFLLLTVQINGSFYSKAGIELAVDPLVEKIFAKIDPADAFIRARNPAVIETGSLKYGS
ncbi:MAG: capsular biosynthesis protein [Rhizobiales bacterium]|nr:capsular biosynthesis protein [Hyphomicrobiales bacterium]